MAHIRGRADVMNHACRLIDDLARIRLHSANQAVEIAYLKDQNAASEAAQADNIARIAHLEDVKAHLEDRIASLEADRAYVMNAIGQEGI
ncbi:hypothetical protein SISSUDRAFT_1051568 [Sistotremastrum suecicum HHB10207 ss-3]|uniref:Uncharacterized protein n=1 Tax=Sistotremastrum suecicum HHB10207 ss-3 TaxID=1314776 RepID=A0A166AHX9_9AGAM|nr:hypothetical protein SISSUDRAFT_1051568 [Sistotremastrum suecicum HHB10207 ss-3]